MVDQVWASLGPVAGPTTTGFSFLICLFFPADSSLLTSPSTLQTALFWFFHLFHQYFTFGFAYSSLGSAQATLRSSIRDLL